MATETSRTELPLERSRPLEIIIVSGQRMPKEKLAPLVEHGWGDMVKFVADRRRRGRRGRRAPTRLVESWHASPVSGADGGPRPRAPRATLAGFHPRMRSLLVQRFSHSFRHCTRDEDLPARSVLEGAFPNSQLRPDRLLKLVGVRSSEKKRNWS